MLTTSQMVTQSVGLIKEKEDYANLGDAFAHWYLVEKFDLSHHDAAEACTIAGPGDKGLDAVYYDDEEQNILCFQFKFSEEGNHAMGSDDILKIHNTIGYCTDRTSLANITKSHARNIFEEIVAKWEMKYNIIYLNLSLLNYYLTDFKST